ncbi:MAG: hypothetical protein M3362_22385 [Acidobacteriota bacterium]|nr:hypothetical protein [Acidobacteriota bacterium]
MYTHARRGRERAEELEQPFFGLSIVEQSFKACAEARQMCNSQREALAWQRERLGAQCRRLVEQAKGAERGHRLLYERLAG